MLTTAGEGGAGDAFDPHSKPVSHDLVDMADGAGEDGPSPAVSCSSRLMGVDDRTPSTKAVGGLAGEGWLGGRSFCCRADIYVCIGGSCCWGGCSMSGILSKVLLKDLLRDDSYSRRQSIPSIMSIVYAVLKGGAVQYHT